MNNLIERQVVIDAICDNCDTVEASCLHYPCGRYVAVEKLPPAQPEKAVKDCRNCKYGNYNDHWETHFCYNPNECTEWNLWEPITQPEPQWIPVSEKLPKLDEAVLATTEWNDITIAWRTGIDKWYIHEGNTNSTTDDLIAWMYLPKPYRVERKTNEVN